MGFYANNGESAHPAPPANAQNVSGITVGLQALPQGVVPPGGHVCVHDPNTHGPGLPTPPQGSSGILVPVRTVEVCRRCKNIDDVDLAVEVQHAAAQGQPPLGLSRKGLMFLSAQPITPASLAKNYLPKVFEGQRTMPIRDILKQLVLTVPGFSRLEPQKARRLTGAALEHRGGGGLHGEVRFEKISWGRWRIVRSGYDSHQSQPVPISTHGAHPIAGPTPPTSLDRNGMPLSSQQQQNNYMDPASYPSGPRQNNDRNLGDDHISMSFQDAFSGSESEDEGYSDADAMSLDEGDQTEEEDWENIAPDVHQMIRRDTSAPSEKRNYNLLSMRHRSPLAQSAPHARTQPISVPAATPQQQHQQYQQYPPRVHGFTAANINVYIPASGSGSPTGPNFPTGASASQPGRPLSPRSPSDEDAAELLLSLRSQ